MRASWSRREFVRSAAAVGATVLTGSRTVFAAARPKIVEADAAWRVTWDAAIATLAGNVASTLPKYAKPCLIEGSTYRGIWQECGPHEGLVYAQLKRWLPAGNVDPLDVARNNHMAFFALQREDGQLPASVKMSDVGFAQIQMVVPIAATAWELAQLRADDKLLHTAYRACSDWDAWLRRYRNTRGTGLVEGFCTYDTGHDNSPRWKGMPNRCADGDARKCPAAPGLPRLCPDLSATVFGARRALAEMARALGRREDEARWLEDAEQIRKLTLDKLYSEEDAAFYDLDSDNRFVRVRSDVISRVLGEHVLDTSQRHDRTIFEAVWKRQLHNPHAFWAPYPLTSIAVDDPAFVRPIPRNSWGGASQALTALRAPRWMRHYGQDEAERVLMHAWCDAIARHAEFRQQLDPETGVFTQPDPGGYSPAALVFLAFAAALSAAE
ncbi:alpha-L-rhamnosidase [Silvibacterium dinghuense]|uniref:Alpha-L-rhamnosidase n=2 Tax=Silvibacterium dinghuense TaxID=1560006 RepID=A0A4Q1SKG4_9BACT|nr:alpha-L-rhamnosidase [Silvibacterium dinghuense]